MTVITPARTTMRPASSLLEGRLLDVTGDVPSVTAELDLLAVEQQRIARETAEVITSMDDDRQDAADLDRLTERLALLLSRAEDVRAARARAAARRAGDAGRWRDYLDPA